MNLKTQLKKYLPNNALDLAVHWIEHHKFQLKITRERLTKFGDFRPPNKKIRYPRISINNNLNQYAFLVTFVHEVAHLITYNSSNKRLQPHGAEWKAKYVQLLQEVIDLDCFPNELVPTLQQHINSPSASSCVDTKLYKALRQYDEKPETLLDDLDIGVLFKLKNGKVFKKGKRIRKRFECIELFRKRIYAVSPIAAVQLLSDEDVAFIKLKLGEDFETELKNVNSDLVKVSSLKEGTKFETNKGKQFIRGKKIKSRFKCKHVLSNELYTISGGALVKVLADS